MKRIILLAAIGALVLGGWASARQIELQNHAQEAKIQPMDDASCTPSAPPSGGA